MVILTSFRYFSKKPKLLIGALSDIFPFPFGLFSRYLRTFHLKRVHSYLTTKNIRDSHLVIFLHGAGASAASWVPVANHTRKYRTLFISFPKIWPLSIRKCAKLVHKKIKLEYQKFPFTKISLVGHSFGGIIAAYYAENMSTYKVHCICTIATPWYSSPCIPIHYASQRYAEINPESEKLKKLRHTVLNSSLTYLSFGSSHDYAVPDPYWINPNSYAVNLRYCGHISILRHKVLWKLLNNFIQNNIPNFNKFIHQNLKIFQ